MKSKTMSAPQATRITAYLDRKLGEHDGQFPEMQWACPFCVDRVGDESSKKKLRVNMAMGKAGCFRCGYGAGSFEYLFKSLSKGKPDASVMALLSASPALAGGGGFITTESAVLRVLFPPLETERVAALKAVPLPAEYVPLLQAKDTLSKWGLAYAKKRGITEGDLYRFKVGYCATGRYAQRLIFPAFMFGKPVYFTNRFCDVNVPHLIKSLNPPNREGYHTATTCFLGFDAVVGKKRVSLVEGPIDWLSTPDSLPTLGKEISDEQIALLGHLVKNGTEEIVVVRDADAEAHGTLARLYGRFPAHVRLTAVVLSHGDPGSRRAEMPALLAARGPLTMRDRVAQCFVRGK